MLPCQYFCRRHVSRFHAVFRNHIRRACRDCGFAAPDIAFQEPVHGMARLKILNHVVYGAKLRFGRLKIKKAQKFFF